MAELAVSDGKAFCICHLDVGLDTNAVRDAVTKVTKEKGLVVLHLGYPSNVEYRLGYSVKDDTKNKAVVYPGVPQKGDKSKGLEVSKWLTEALRSLKGKCGRGKDGLAQGQGTDASQLKEADIATKFASMMILMVSFFILG